MAAKGKGQEVNRGELAQIMGVTPPTVDAWVRDGCPQAAAGSRGVAAKFNTADVAKWLRDKARSEGAGKLPDDEDALRKRRLLADTLRAELALAKEMGEVAPIEEFERAQVAAMTIVRTNMLQVPARAVLQLIGCTDETQFKQVLRAEIVLALESAASAEIDITDEELSDNDDD